MTELVGCERYVSEGANEMPFLNTLKNWLSVLMSFIFVSPLIGIFVMPILAQMAGVGPPPSTAGCPGCVNTY